MIDPVHDVHMDTSDSYSDLGTYTLSFCVYRRLNMLQEERLARFT